MLARARHAALAAAACLIAACGGGGDTSPRDIRLNREEAQNVTFALFEEMSAALVDEIGGLEAVPAARAAAARRPFSAARLPAARLRAAAGAAETVTADCARGGKIVLTFDFPDDFGENGTSTGSMDMRPEGCVVSTGERTLAVDGDPSLKYTYSASYANGQPSGDFVWKASGGIRWAGGGCRMDYTMRLSPNGSGSVTGTMCGESVNQTFGADD